MVEPWMSMLRLCLAADLGSSSRRYTKVMKGYERSAQIIELFNNPVLGWQIHCNGGWLREGGLRLPEQLISKEGRPCCYWRGRKTDWPEKPSMSILYIDGLSCLVFEKSSLLSCQIGPHLKYTEKFNDRLRRIFRDWEGEERQVRKDQHLVNF